MQTDAERAWGKTEKYLIIGIVSDSSNNFAEGISTIGKKAVIWLGGPLVHQRYLVLDNVDSASLRFLPPARICLPTC